MYAFSFHILLNSRNTGLGCPSKSTSDVLIIQGKLSCPIHMINPPHAGNRSLFFFNAIVRPFVCLSWLHLIYALISLLFPPLVIYSSHSIHQLTFLQRGFSMLAGRS